MKGGIVVFGMIAIWGILYLSVIGLVIYVAYHFITKFW